MRMGFASVAGTTALSLALLAVGTIAASVLVGRIGSNWPVVLTSPVGQVSIQI